MTGHTIIIGLHAFRGFRREGGPLGAILIFGWVSLSYVPFLLTQWLRGKIDGLRAVTDLDDDSDSAGA